MQGLKSNNHRLLFILSSAANGYTDCEEKLCFFEVVCIDRSCQALVSKEFYTNSWRNEKTILC